MKNIKDLDIRNKKVLIRVDFNVPLDEHGNITDDIRIRGVLPTINYALDENARIIMIFAFLNILTASRPVPMAEKYFL